MQQPAPMGQNMMQVCVNMHTAGLGSSHCHVPSIQLNPILCLQAGMSAGSQAGMMGGAAPNAPRDPRLQSYQAAQPVSSMPMMPTQMGQYGGQGMQTKIYHGARAWIVSSSHSCMCNSKYFGARARIITLARALFSLTRIRFCSQRPWIRGAATASQARRRPIWAPRPTFLSRYVRPNCMWQGQLPFRKSEYASNCHWYSLELPEHFHRCSSPRTAHRVRRQC
jgi:hypothetical protein